MSDAKTPSVKKEVTHVYIRSWPKSVLLYPLLVVSLIFGVLSLGLDYEKATGTMGVVFLLILGVNLFVMTFDFNTTKSVAIFFAVIAILFILLFISSKTDVSVLAWLRSALGKVHAVANASFYFGTAAVLGFLFICMFIHTRINYWEVTRNEILHHHGLFGAVDRFPAPNVEFSKQYNDIFEFGLLLSGSLTIFLASKQKNIVLETVPFIKRVEDKLNVLLSEIAVDVNIQDGT
jgi:hypothetical protein